MMGGRGREGFKAKLTGIIHSLVWVVETAGVEVHIVNQGLSRLVRTTEADGAGGGSGYFFVLQMNRTVSPTQRRSLSPLIACIAQKSPYLCNNPIDNALHIFRLIEAVRVRVLLLVDPVPKFNCPLEAVMAPTLL